MYRSYNIIKRGGLNVAYTAMEVSKYIIEHTNGNVSNLKLQKMLFYAQMEYIQEYSEKLFDDKIEAWRHGPVIRDVYRKFKKYISSPIETDSCEIQDIYISSLLCDKKATKVIKDIIARTCNIDAWDLVTKTHETSAWKDNYVEDWNNEISFSDLQKSNFNI